MPRACVVLLQGYFLHKIGDPELSSGGHPRGSEVVPLHYMGMINAAIK